MPTHKACRERAASRCRPSCALTRLPRNLCEPPSDAFGPSRAFGSCYFRGFSIRMLVQLREALSAAQVMSSVT